MNRLGKLFGGAALAGTAFYVTCQIGRYAPYAAEILYALDDKDNRPCRRNLDTVSLRHYGSGKRVKGVIQLTSDSINASLDEFDGDITFNDGNLWDTIILAVATNFEETPSSLRTRTQNITRACYRLEGKATVITTEEK